MDGQRERALDNIYIERFWKKSESNMKNNILEILKRGSGPPIKW